MRIEHEPNIAALRRDWLGAWIAGAFGALLLLAGLAVIVHDTAVRPVAAPARLRPQPDRAAQRQEDIALCDAALAAAQGLGVVPGFAVRDGDETAPGGARGRYICRARTEASHYAITFDLACTRLGAPNCIVPIAVAQDGTVVYRRN